MAKPNAFRCLRTDVSAGLFAVLAVLAGTVLVGALKATPYKAPVKGLEVAYAEVRRGKVDQSQITVVQRVTAVKGDMVSFTEWSRTGGLIISQKHDRLRSIFSSRIQFHNGTVLHDFDKKELRGLWPLAPGRTATVNAKLYFGPEKTVADAKAKLRQGRTVVQRYEVVRMETVKLAAGTFSTFVIQRAWETRGADGVLRESGVDTIWLAPKISWIVRFDQRITGGPRKGTQRMLAAISIKRRATGRKTRK